MELILTGGGSGEDTKEIDSFFASRIDKSKPLLYIPIAIDNIKHPYGDCLEWLRSTFYGLGISKYNMWTEDNLVKLGGESPKDYGGIYIGGGNTYYLIDRINKTELKGFILGAIKEGIPIYGGSAGAIVFGSSIANSGLHDKDWVSTNNSKGLDTMNGLSIACHYVSREKDELLSIFKRDKLKYSILLPEKSAIYVKNKNIKLIGKESAVLLSYGGEGIIQVGEKINLS